MFKKLFRQNRSVDIDRLIFDIAEYKRTEIMKPSVTCSQGEFSSYK